MVLCSNRPEGFGPHSNLHPSLPTTCFLDVIVVPLATWIYLFLLILVFLPLSVVAYRRRHSSVPKTAFFNPDEQTPISAPSKGKRVRRIVLRTLYGFLILAIIAMVSLEIARLNVAELGIGLLPFLYPGILLVAALHTWLLVGAKRRQTGKGGLATGSFEQKIGWAINTFYWVMLIVVLALKLATLVLEDVHKDSASDAANRSRYSLDDEVTDVAVMVFLVLVLAILEGLGLGDIC